MKNSFRNVLISALVIMFLYQFTACSRPTLPDKIIVLDEEIVNDSPTVPENVPEGINYLYDFRFSERYDGSITGDLNNQKRADIAIVKLKPKNEREGCFLRDCIEELLAIIELKFKGSSADSQVFYNDVYKLKEYAKSYPDVQLYAGFIQESLYNDSNCSWFDGRQTSKWAKGRVTELLGYWDEKNEEFIVKVNAYNNLNLDVI